MIRCIVRGPLKLVEKAEEAEIHDGLSIWKWELAVGPKLALLSRKLLHVCLLVLPFNLKPLPRDTSILIAIAISQGSFPLPY